MNGLPPIHRWWVTYVLVGSAAVIAFVGALAALGTLFSPILHVVVVVLFALVLAFLLSPLVRRLQRYMPRALAITLAFLGALAIVVGGFTLIATPLVREARGLTERLPEYVGLLRSDEPLTVGGFEIPGELRQRVGTAIAERAGEAAERGALIVFRVVGAVVDLVLVLVLALYFLGAAPRLRAGVLYVLPQRYRAEARRLEDEVADIFGRYIRGQLFLALVIGVVSTVVFSLLGVRYALLLGVLAGILELVPIVGPIVAGTIAAIVALFQPFPLIIWVIIAATAIQQLENHLLVPRISGAAVGIPPVAALLAVLIGIQLVGIAGGLFAVPVAGLIFVYARRWLARHRRPVTPRELAETDAEAEAGRPGRGEVSSRDEGPTAETTRV